MGIVHRGVSISNRDWEEMEIERGYDICTLIRAIDQENNSCVDLKQ